MKKKYILLILSLTICAVRTSGQTFISYFTGDTANVVTIPQPGTVLMGGSTENDSAMVWWLKKAQGGDVLVIRSSGSNGYNEYLFSALGETVNSVETIKFNSREASFDPYVIRRLAECEALWIAGGDQGVYTNYWKDSPVDSLINDLVLNKKIPIGGTSAGMAILGGAYFNALQGSVTSSQALANPYNPLVSIGRNDFLKISFLDKVITDTHFDNPDRRGRHLAFLARLYQDSGFAWKGICSEEKTAVCVDEFGIGRVFGNSSANEFAYFTQISCLADTFPQVCSPGLPLTWKPNNGPVLVCKIPGTNQGNNFFDLTDWKTMSGGIWEYWSSDNGVFGNTSTNFPDCSVSAQKQEQRNQTKIFPNPGTGVFKINGYSPISKVIVYDVLGHSFEIPTSNFENTEVDLTDFPKGMYTFELVDKGGISQYERIRVIIL